MFGWFVKVGSSGWGVVPLSLFVARCRIPLGGKGVLGLQLLGRAAAILVHFCVLFLIPLPATIVLPGGMGSSTLVGY